VNSLEAARKILDELGLPRAQRNERSALTLLALLDLQPGKAWSKAASPLVGITPIMDWVRANYGKNYAPNTRETVRRQTMHQFVQAGLVRYNPDKPDRAVNSPHAVYQISEPALSLFQTYGSRQWPKALSSFRSRARSLADQFANERAMTLIPVRIADDKEISLSPGEHSELIRSIIESFAPRFAAGSTLIYVGDTGDKSSYFQEEMLAALGVTVDRHGKMPDVVIHDVDRNWLLLIESVTSHGPVNAKRHEELLQLFGEAKCGLVFVTAFPSRSIMARYLADIAWETEVWTADAPSHLIHFNGERYLGPHGAQ
jgi:hypothetical protein